MLKEVRKEYLNTKDADSVWFAQVVKETEAAAERYPGYLNCDAAQPGDFGETAIRILTMQSEGCSVREIAQTLYMSERTVKYHAAENYRKLGARGKTDAVQIARRLHLI